MEEGESLAIQLDYWDDTVGAFEPAKVLRQLERVFANVEIDPTDQQRERLLRELELWSQSTSEPNLKNKLIRQSWGLYQTNGPTYKFIIPFPSGHRVPGQSRRLRIGFQLPPGLPNDYREQLVGFLKSLQMGEPKFDTEEDIATD